MFGAKTKARAVPERNPAHHEVRLYAGTLISVANRVEASSAKSGEPTLTNAMDVVMARELLAAQHDLQKSIDAALVRGLTVEELQTQILEPVMESSVVGDVAWLVLQNVVRGAREAGRGPPGKVRL